MPEQSPESGPFRTWTGRDSWEFVDGVRLHAIGGEQVLLCRVQYAPDHVPDRALDLGLGPDGGAQHVEA